MRLKKLLLSGHPMELQTKYLSVVLMGKIASGKGTQGHLVAEAANGVIYSNGNKMRAVAAQDTVFGNKIKAVYDEGLLMPEWIASYWMAHAIVDEHLTDLIVFEGVARKPNEAVLFHEIHEWIGRKYVVFNLDISDDVVRARSADRARDTTDSLKVVEKRLEEFHTYTQKSIEFFRTKGTLIEIDGTLSPEEVKTQIFNYLIA